MIKDASGLAAKLGYVIDCLDAILEDGDNKNLKKAKGFLEKAQELFIAETEAKTAPVEFAAFTVAQRQKTAKMRLEMAQAKAHELGVFGDDER
jgi:hypothetical protein